MVVSNGSPPSKNEPIVVTIFQRARGYGVSAVSIAAALLATVTPALAQFEPQWNAGGRPGPDRQDRGSEPRHASPRGNWLLSLEAVTNAPVDVGARITAEAPFRVRLATGFGVVPGPYLGLINEAVSSAGAYDARTAEIVDGSFSGGTAWRTQLGFRPFAKSGLYVDAGYARVSLSGDVYGSDVAPQFEDVELDGVLVRDAGYRVDTTLHMWLVEIGWHARLENRITLGAGLGVLGTLAANSTARANFEAGRTGSGATLSREATQRIDDAIETYGYVPTLTLRVGYDFL